MYIFEKVEQEPTAMTMTGATHTIELDENSDYSMLLLRFNWTADSSQIDASKERILDWITSITVIGDDDKYIVNASARELAALHFYRRRYPVFEVVDNKDNSTNILELPIYFGRYFGDTEYFLRGGIFNKLELNVTNGDSATGNYFDAGTLEVRSYQFKDHALSPTAVLRPKQIKSWTPPSATASHTETLPDKWRIEKILIEAQPTYQDRTTDLTAEYWELLDKIKLTFKGGDVVVFNDDTEELAWRNALVYGLARTSGYFTGQENDFVDSGLGYRRGAHATLAQDASAAGLEPEILKNTTQKLKWLQQGTAADTDYYWEAWGQAYLDTVIFDWAPDGNMANLYDPAVYKKGQLKLTAGSTAGKINIMVVEEVTSF